MSEIDWTGILDRFSRELYGQPSPVQSYAGAPYTSKDPGTYRYRSGEVESDVGLLDPVEVLAGMLASKGVGLLSRARELPRAYGGPRTTRSGQLLQTERGSLGRAGLPEPNDFGIPPELLPKIQNARDRIEAAMTEMSEYRGDYDIPELINSTFGQLNQRPGEPLRDYVERLYALERRYNPDAIYGRGEFPPSELFEVLKALGGRTQVPLHEVNLRAVKPATPPPSSPDFLQQAMERLGQHYHEAFLGQGDEFNQLQAMLRWEDLSAQIQDFLKRSGGFQRLPRGAGTPPSSSLLRPPPADIQIPGPNVQPDVPPPWGQNNTIGEMLEQINRYRNDLMKGDRPPYMKPNSARGFDFWMNALQDYLRKSGGHLDTPGPDDIPF